MYSSYIFYNVISLFVYDLYFIWIINDYDNIFVDAKL